MCLQTHLWIISETVSKHIANILVVSSWWMCSKYKPFCRSPLLHSMIWIALALATDPHKDPAQSLRWIMRGRGQYQGIIEESGVDIKICVTRTHCRIMSHKKGRLTLKYCDGEKSYSQERCVGWMTKVCSKHQILNCVSMSRSLADGSFVMFQCLEIFCPGLALITSANSFSSTKPFGYF